jgi:hypothetical protein
LGEYESNEVFYVADPGERNELQLILAPDGRRMTVVDAGAVIRAGESCSTVDVHTAICRAPTPPPGYIAQARADLGDLDDRLSVPTTFSQPYAFYLSVTANGGPGDDRLAGGRRSDVFDGGGGRDVIAAGDGGDILSDGDRDGAPGDRSPGPDRLDGGPGFDRVTYEQRRRSVRVDLADDTPDGARDERDRLRGIEYLTGGAGDDQLAGDRADNVLDGGPGLNRLTGRAGDDALLNASGSYVSCGPGSDTVAGLRLFTLVPRTCERHVMPLDVDELAVSLPLFPEKRHGQLGIRISCPPSDGSLLDCAPVVVVRERSGGRPLARGSGLMGWWDIRRLGLRPTPLGRRVLASPGHPLITVELTIKLRYGSLPKAGWTVRL